MERIPTARSLLRNNLLFRNLGDATLDRLAGLASRRRVARGTTLFRQGDAGDSLYAVVSGQVRISASASGGREVFLNLMEAGDTFGEIAIIDGQSRTASATTVTDCDLLTVSRADFLGLMHEDPTLPIHLLQLFCQRVRWTSDAVEASALLSLPARLARRLLRLAQDHGEADGPGRSLRISQAELGNFLALSRQAVNRHLQEWREAGLLDLARGRIIILDIAALERVASEAAPADG
jgi:CRP/FNR family transcriptional regulator, cyclic AMP receptor protein